LFGILIVDFYNALIITLIVRWFLFDRSILTLLFI